MLHGPKRTQKRSKELRQNMTLPEVLLWQALRKRGTGLRFRHQHPAGNYNLDFYCARHRLAVEVDGEAHARGDQPERDTVRDAWLRSEGVRVVRIPASVILADLEPAVHHIKLVARGELPLHHSPSASGPPPPPGED